jgi:hypothetical protein
MKKDHFPLPLIDEMLERLAKHSFFCFLDGYSGYHQIPIHHDDQSKITFTCPYGSYAYRRMLLGLCTAPTSFQSCKMSIFFDMIEEIMEVFMDDFSIYGKNLRSLSRELGKGFAEMPREGPSAKLGKVPFYGPRRHRAWAPHVQEWN